jgi:type IV secretion system protein TrbL
MICATARVVRRGKGDVWVESHAICFGQGRRQWRRATVVPAVTHRGGIPVAAGLLSLTPRARTCTAFVRTAEFTMALYIRGGAGALGPLGSSAIDAAALDTYMRARAIAANRLYDEGDEGEAHAAGGAFLDSSSGGEDEEDLDLAAINRGVARPRPLGASAARGAGAPRARRGAVGGAQPPRGGDNGTSAPLQRVSMGAHRSRGASGRADSTPAGPLESNVGGSSAAAAVAADATAARRDASSQNTDAGGAAGGAETATRGRRAAAVAAASSDGRGGRRQGRSRERDTSRSDRSSEPAHGTHSLHSRSRVAAAPEPSGAGSGSGGSASEAHAGAATQRASFAPWEGKGMV